MALLIALALALRGLVEGLILVYGRETLRREVFTSLTVVMFFLILLLGEWLTLRALLDCSHGACADPNTLDTVVFALIAGAALVLVFFVLGAVSALHNDASRSGSG